MLVGSVSRDGLAEQGRDTRGGLAALGCEIPQCGGLVKGSALIAGAHILSVIIFRRSAWRREGMRRG